MNDLIRSDLKTIKELICEEELVKEYVKVKSQIDSSPYIKSLKNEMKFYKKCEMNDEERENYYNTKNKLDSDPLLSNFENLKKEVEQFKREIKEILEL
ncbi:MAG: YlbF family regulator [Bacilli bacterium]|nr:YlbF family regulator [Bacilli bacterium]